MIVNRNILSIVLLAAISSVVGGALLLGIQPTDQPTVYSSPGLMLPEHALGERVSLADAEQHALFDFRVPEKLPAGATLEMVYLHDTKELVYLLYNNSISPALFQRLPIVTSIIVVAQSSDTDRVSQMLDGDILPMVVKVLDEDGNERVVAEIPQEPSGIIVKVCNADAFAPDPSGDEPRILNWWKDGVEYLIEARLSLNELLSMANSMC